MIWGPGSVILLERGVLQRPYQVQRGMAEERRRHKRFEVDDMEIRGKMVFASEVKIANMSISGVSIKADRRLDIGSEYTLKVEDRERTLVLKGIVVWSNICGSKETSHGEHIPLYAAGLKFTNVLNERVNDILNFIDMHKTESEHRVTGLRFKIDEAEKAVMSFSSGYRVKRISLSGMLIESPQPLDINATHTMEISLPDEKPVRFMGKVASCQQQPGKGGELFHIGIAFSRMSEKDTERLRQFIVMLRDLSQGAS